MRISDKKFDDLLLRVMNQKKRFAYCEIVNYDFKKGKLEMRIQSL